MKNQGIGRKPALTEEKRRGRTSISVMFIPYTVNGILAKQLREAEEELGRQTGYKIKIVERTGTRLADLLHKSNPWQGEDCKRPGCLICSTKVAKGRNMEQDCTKRYIVYKTWCMTCAGRGEKKIGEKYEDEETQNKMIREIKLYKYVGGSARSSYERGLEHSRDLQELKKESHMLKHFFACHEGEELKDMKFGMRIVKVHRSAFNRQISESVEIQNQKMKHEILNSKSEYNRCALPRLTARIGDENYKKIDSIRRDKKEKEHELERRIRDLKVKQSRNRREEPGIKQQPEGN